MTNKLLTGNEAIAHAALEAGVGVVAGYPGMPSSGIAEAVARQCARGAAHDVHVEWSTNEKVALEMLFGASLAGKRCLFTCKQRGLSVASEALLDLNYASVRGGLVLIVADDPGPLSSQTEQDTRRFASFAKVPVLDPATPEQAFRMVLAAFDLSEHFRTPVIVRPTTRINHASAFLDVKEETTALPPLDDGFDRDPKRWVISPRRAYEAHAEVNKRISDIAKVFSSEPTFASFNQMDEAGESFTGEPTFGIMCGGITASYTREALRMINARARRAGIGISAYRLMQIGTPYPFPERAIAAFTTGLADVLVLEELDSVLEDELARFAGRTHAAFNLHGKRSGEARDHGENDVDDILARIERFLGLTGRLSLHRLRGGEERSTPVRLAARAEAELPEREPVLCAGCPHRGTFYAVKKALEGENAVMCGDIGCSLLGAAQPLEAFDTSLGMGAGITMAQGFSIADPGAKAIAFIGDSAFFASGMPALANAAYNGHDITVVVLDNSTTAASGCQPNPGTGETLAGGAAEPLDIEAVLLANGFPRVYHANPFEHDSSVVAVRAAVADKGPTAVIFKAPCALIAEVHAPVVVNRDVCTGCKRCVTEIGCPAIGFNGSIKGDRSRDRGQAVIDASLCMGCGLCAQVCSFRAIHGDLGAYRAARTASAAEHPKLYDGVQEATRDQRAASVAAAKAISPAAAERDRDRYGAEDAFEDDAFEGDFPDYAADEEAAEGGVEAAGAAPQQESTPHRGYALQQDDAPDGAFLDEPGAEDSAASGYAPEGEPEPESERVSPGELADGDQATPEPQPEREPEREPEPEGENLIFDLGFDDGEEEAPADEPPLAMDFNAIVAPALEPAEPAAPAPLPQPAESVADPVRPHPSAEPAAPAPDAALAAAPEDDGALPHDMYVPEFDPAFDPDFEPSFESAYERARDPEYERAHDPAFDPDFTPAFDPPYEPAFDDEPPAKRGDLDD